MHYIKYVYTLVKTIQELCTKFFYSKSQRYFFFSPLEKGTYPVEKREARSSIFGYASNSLNPYYVTGFTDGEGCFSITVSPNPRYKTGYRVKAVFHIGLHIRDLALLEQIQLLFGVGKITKLGAESVLFRVSGIEDFKVIINHLDK